jgi:hypothetical protein
VTFVDRLHSGRTVKRTMELAPRRKRASELRQEIKQKQVRSSANKAAARSHEEFLERSQTAIADFSALAESPAGSDDLFVLGFVCRRVPKCPDPDERLFATQPNPTTKEVESGVASS